MVIYDDDNKNMMMMTMILTK